jgi:hypothetical protein
MPRTTWQEQDSFDRHEWARAAECEGDTPASRFSARTAALRQKPLADKINELRRLGINIAEQGVHSSPCRVCAFAWRYSAFPDRCLYCEAMNEE